MTGHIDHHHAAVNDIERLLDKHGLTEDELMQAAEIALNQCEHLGPTLDRTDGAWSYEECAKCGHVIHKYRI